MKEIALASDDDSGLQGSLSAHFGRCPFYTFVNVEGDEILGLEVVRSTSLKKSSKGLSCLNRKTERNKF